MVAVKLGNKFKVNWFWKIVSQGYYQLPKDKITQLCYGLRRRILSKYNYVNCTEWQLTAAIRIVTSYWCGHCKCSHVGFKLMLFTLGFIFFLWQLRWLSGEMLVVNFVRTDCRVRWCRLCIPRLFYALFVIFHFLWSSGSHGEKLYQEAWIEMFCIFKGHFQELVIDFFPNCWLKSCGGIIHFGALYWKKRKKN